MIFVADTDKNVMMKSKENCNTNETKNAPFSCEFVYNEQEGNKKTTVRELCSSRASRRTIQSIYSSEIVT